MAKDMCECYKEFQGNDCADRTCLFGRAHADTPKGDIDMDQDLKSPLWILDNSQQHPAGTYEYFNPDALSDEAHFYMECSNKGICDRSTGLCACFDGYEGNGCQRTVCPGKCSGHGTCESIRELGEKAAGTLFGANGPAGAVKYELWDERSTYGCRCDPWFFGPDCNRRSCKVGVDPLFLSAGSATYETFVVHAAVAAAGSLTDAWVRLRLFDYYGESYITRKIPVLSDVAPTDAETNAAEVARAIKEVPNLTFRDVKCEPANVALSDFEGFKSKRDVTTLGMSVVCQFVDNPGKMRIPDIASSNIVVNPVVVTTSQQGWDDEWFTQQTLDIVDEAATSATTVTLLATATAALDPAAVPMLVKIGPHIVLVTNIAATVVTIAYDLSHALGSGMPVFVAPSGLITGVTVGPATSVATAVGDTYLQYAADPSTNHPVGSLLFFHNAFYTVQKIYLDSLSSAWNLVLNKPFGGGTADGLEVAIGGTAYKVDVALDARTRVYNYVSECSGRGVCVYDTGICTCFKGYTSDNCNTQNILAL